MGYATLIGIKQARNKPLQQLTLADLEGKLGTNLQTIGTVVRSDETEKNRDVAGVVD